MEHLGPFPEGQVGRNDNRSQFIQFREQMEKQLAAVFRKGKITQFIEYNEIKASQYRSDFATVAFQFFLLQCVGQIHQIIKLGAASCSDRVRRYRDG